MLDGRCIMRAKFSEQPWSERLEVRSVLVLSRHLHCVSLQKRDAIPFYATVRN